MSEYAEIQFNIEDFEEFTKTRDENIVLGINIGMEIEVKSRNFYQSMVRKLPSDKKFILKLLANEELDHIKTLLTFKTALQKNDKWIELRPKQQRRIRIPRLYGGKGSVPFIAEDASDLDIILAAMKAEKRTEQFYKRIEKKVRAVKAKSLFNFMAKFERGHYNLLKNVLS